VRSDRRLGVRVIAEELNMNSESVRQIVKEDLGMRNISAKMVPHMARNNDGFTFLLIFYARQRFLIGSLPVIKRVFNTTRKQITEHAVKNTEFTSAEKSTYISVAGKDHACVFLRSQGDRSL